jgi:hypothetical protein
MLILAVVLAVAACAAPPSPTPWPSASAEPTPWLDATIAQPDGITTGQSAPPGVQGHPFHFLAENDLFGVGSWPGGLIAVGVQEPPAQAVAFSSRDGATWVPLDGFTGADGTTAIAAATNAGRTVLVGLDAGGAAAWTSTGGVWTATSAQPDLLAAHAGAAMTSVTAFGDGFVAGGYHDDPLQATASAAVWRSTDGLTWHADEAASTFAGGRAWGVAASGDTIVAVGTGGDPNYGPAAAWRWTRSTGWQRATIGSDTGGAMRAVTAGTSGFVAVGLNAHDDGAQAWTSPDGRDWTAIPDQPSLHYYDRLAMRMQSIVATPDGFLAGGWRSDAGKGSAVTWASADGVTWQPSVWEPSFSGGQIRGLGVLGGSVVAVGRTGYPDWNTAAIWISAAP